MSLHPSSYGQNNWSHFARYPLRNYLEFEFEVLNQHETLDSGCVSSTPEFPHGIAQIRIACAAAAESPQTRNIGELFERQNVEFTGPRGALVVNLVILKGALSRARRMTLSERNAWIREVETIFRPHRQLVASANYKQGT